MSTEAHKKASAKYSRKNTKRYAVEFNLKTDADIITFLDMQDNKQGLIKRLLRDEMKKEGK